MQDLQGIHEEWARHWGGKSPAERNKQLATRMKLATQGDSYGMDIAKQGAKEYLSGAISAREFKDLFIGVVLMGEETHPGLGEELFKEMTMLVPIPDKRAQLLSLCDDPWVLPTERSAPAPAPAPASALVQSETQSLEDQDVEDGGEADEDGEDEYEYEDEDEDEDEGSSYADEQEEDYEGEEDIKEFKGWQVLDRSRILALAAEMIAAEKESESVEVGEERDRGGSSLLAVDADGSTHVNSLGTRPARKLSKEAKREKKAKQLQSLLFKRSCDCHRGLPHAIRVSD